MTVAILPRVYRERARSMQTVVEAFPEEDWSLQDARDLIRECKVFATVGRELLERSYANAFQGVGQENARHSLTYFSDLVAIREDIDEALICFLAVMEGVRKRLRNGPSPAKSTGAADLLELEESIQVVQKLREELRENWPVCTSTEIEEARLEIARGAGEEVSDAFARMGGIGKEVLSQRLEEHKRRRAALGME